MGGNLSHRPYIEQTGTILIVSACDEGYFPLLKGLFLSIFSRNDQQDLAFGFLDLGCSDESLEWLRLNGVIIKELDEQILGSLCNPDLGAARAQTCRPFLPRLFPDMGTIAWMDADMWVQDISGFLKLITWAQKCRDKVHAAPEVHFLYSGVNDHHKREREMTALNEAVLSREAALEMACLPVYNSGFFIASAEHPFWDEWAALIGPIYLQKRHSMRPSAAHFSEQVAFNYVLRLLDCACPFDPLYNYVCIWSPPVRDELGVVRLSAAPHVPVGVVHLAGGWQFLRRKYLRRGLLYERGIYLDAADIALLDTKSRLVRR